MNTGSIGREALLRVVDEVGLSELSRRIGVRYQLIQGWMDESRRFATPADYCPLIERATDGRVRCEDLRPDVAWGVVRGTGSEREDA